MYQDDEHVHVYIDTVLFFQSKVFQYNSTKNNNQI